MVFAFRDEHRLLQVANFNLKLLLQNIDETLLTAIGGRQKSEVNIDNFEYLVAVTRHYNLVS